VKKFVTILVAGALLIVLSTTAVAAGTIVKEIEFSLEGSCEVFDPVTGELSMLPASAILSGNIKHKNGTKYLSPLTGKLMVEGMEHNIMVKMAKQSEPIYHHSWEDGIPGEWYHKIKTSMIAGESNVQGAKLIVQLQWNYEYHDHGGGDIFEEGWSWLWGSGMVDGQWVQCSLGGGLPAIE
jgi:hypothetical protein